MDMDVEASQQQQRSKEEEEEKDSMGGGLKRFLVVLNCFLMVLGNTGGIMTSRLYYIRGGHRQWLSSWLETGGWPLILLPLAASYHRRRRLSGRTKSTKPFLITHSIFAACVVLGILTGLDDFFYAYGLSFLPVSTLAILTSTHLAFTAFFAFLVVRQRFTAYSINAVALLTVGAAVLGLHTSADRPPGVTKAGYSKGFVLTLGAAALYGLVLPLIELTYARAKQAITYTLVMEMQLVMGFFATAFCTVGMWINNDFKPLLMENPTSVVLASVVPKHAVLAGDLNSKSDHGLAIPSEARHFELGEVRYYVVLVWCAIFWQCFFMGIVGVIFCTNTLLAAIIIAVFIPINGVLGVIFFHEKFSGEKGVALALSLWGLASYSYGEYKEGKKKKASLLEAQTTQPPT